MVQLKGDVALRVAFKIFRRDIGRILRVPFAVIVVVGVCFLPAMYAWFNIAGFWDPYANTSHLRVAVVNEDKGATTAATGKIDAGAQVAAQIKDNHDLGWYFTTRQGAIDDVKTGKSYAAIIIPANFSTSLVSFMDPQHYTQPKLEYYVNQKLNAVAPQITNAGASTLDRKINSAFVSQVSKAVTTKLGDFSKQVRTQTATVNANTDKSLAQGAQKLAAASASVQSQSQQIDQARAKIASAQNSLTALQTQVTNLSQIATNTGTLLSTTATTITDFSSKAPGILDKSASLTVQATGKLSVNAANLNGAVQSAQGRVDGVVSELESINQTQGQILTQLQNAGLGNVPGGSDALAILTQQNTNAATSLSNLRTVGSSISATSTSLSDAASALNTAANTSTTAFSSARESVFSSSLPQVSSSLYNMDRLSGTLAVTISNQNQQITQLKSMLTQLDKNLAATQSALNQSATTLTQLQSDLESTRADLGAISGTSALRQLTDKLDVSADKVANFMLSPTLLSTHKVYPVANYGSAMAPVFTNLTLWVGAFMLVVLIKLNVDSEGIGAITHTQAYMGRWLLMAAISAVQAIVVTTGDLILGVQHESVVLFYLATILIGWAYLSIIYALSASFQHIGKGLCVVMVILQIPGSSGLYPIEMVPSFFGWVYPVLPFKYGVAAVREVIGGFYAHHFLYDLGVLALMAAGSFAVGIGLRPFLVNINRLTAAAIAEGGLFNAEDTRDSRRWRTTQILHALADREDYRWETDYQRRRFERLYPRMRVAAIVLGVVVPAVTALTSSFSNTNQRITYVAVWMVWLVAMIGFLVYMEYRRDRLERQAALLEMGDGEIKAMLHGHMGRRRQGRSRSRLALAEISADAAGVESADAAAAAGRSQAGSAKAGESGRQVPDDALGRSRAETAQIPVVDEGEGR